MALSDNQVLALKLDESSGDAADASGNGYTYTNNGSTPFAAAKINNGANFGTSNTTKYFKRTDSIGFTTNSSIVISVSAWVYFQTGFGNNDATMIFSVRSANSFHMIFNVRGNAGGATGKDMECYMLGVTGINNKIDHTFNTGQWYHLVWVINGSSYNFYVDGTSIGTGTMSYPSGSAGSAESDLGGNNIGSFMRGYIDELYVWNRALTSGDVTALYNSGAGSQYPYATNVTASPSVLSSTFSIPATTVTAVRNATISAGVQSATFSSPARTVTGTANVTASVVSALFSIPAVNIITPDAQINASVLTATFSIPAPTARISNTVSQGTPPSATFSIPASTVRIGFTHASNVFSATFTVPAPTISAESNITISPSALSATFSLPAVTVTSEQNAMIEAGVLSATFSVQAPTVTAIRNITVDASVLSALFSTQTPRKVGGLWTAQPRFEGVWTPQARAI